MQINQIFWLVVAILALLFIILFFVGSYVAPLKVVAFLCGTVVLGMLAYVSIKNYKKHKEYDESESESEIDKMLESKQNGTQQVEKQDKKSKFSKNLSNLNGKYMPFALICLTAIMGYIFIRMLIAIV